MVASVRLRGRASRVAAVGVAVGALATGACSATGSAPTPAPVGSTTAGGTVAPSTPAGVPDLHPSVDGYPAGTVEVVADDGTVHTVAVRIAETPAQRTHGLMEVPDVPAGVGMWFVYEEETTGGFWMKNTLVPLDIAYVGADGRVVSIAHAEPCTADPCPTYEPDAPYMHVLEVNAGAFERMGAGIGARVRLVDRAG